MNTEGRIRDIAVSYREELEQYLDFADNPHAVMGMCRTASHELCILLEKSGFTATAVFTRYNRVSECFPHRMQDVFGYEEMNDFTEGEEFDGTWRHWIVVCGGFIVDVTSDQFHPSGEGEPVVITDTDDLAYGLNCEVQVSGMMF